MKRVQLFRSDEDLEVADIDGDTVTFRTFEFGHEGFPPDEPFERCGFSMSLAELRKVVKAADEA